jgi:hypothetical protein
MVGELDLCFNHYESYRAFFYVVQLPVSQYADLIKIKEWMILYF